MTVRFARILFVLAAPLLLASCLLPGRFTATLDIGRDRSFTFTYVGEAVVIDPSSAVRVSAEGSGEASLETDQPQEMAEADRQRVIAALSREVGFRSVEYVGENKFRIDYSISGRLDRSYAFPVNLEGLALIPWLVVEVRGDGTAQVSAHGFGDGDGNSNTPNAPEPNRHRQGTFTLTTDAELVQHNSERRAAPGGRSSLSWEVTPEPRPAPSALVRFAD
jgi:hypothetical protein